MLSLSKHWAGFFSSLLDRNPFDLAEADLVGGAVVELRGSRRFVRGDLLRVLERATVLVIRARRRMATLIYNVVEDPHVHVHDQRCCRRKRFKTAVSRPRVGGGVSPRRERLTTRAGKCSATRGLRSLGIRVRGLYAMKATYISTAFTAGVNTVWLEAQTGVRYETMKRHYGKWLRLEGANQLRKDRPFGGKRNAKGGT